jgi:hypothetical protein
MLTTSDRLWLRWLFALTASSWGGCLDALIGDGEVCADKDGKFCMAGEEFRQDCNTCTCRADGTSDCSTIACANDAGVDPGEHDTGTADPGPRDGGGPDASSACQFGDQGFDLGETLERSDGCGPCPCIEAGKLDCEIAPRCRDAATPACSYQGEDYFVGPFKSADGCQQSTCDQNGTVVCSGRTLLRCARLHP